MIKSDYKKPFVSSLHKPREEVACLSQARQFAQKNTEEFFEKLGSNPKLVEFRNKLAQDKRVDFAGVFASASEEQEVISKGGPKTPNAKGNKRTAELSRPAPL